jgi:hypothetical protein
MPELKKRFSPGSIVEQTGSDQWRLSIPSGPAGKYRWAQLDDYMHLPRSQFHWQEPVRLEISVRVSDPSHNGTWGFGFWNDPFSLSLGIGGTSQRLPALPNAAWFFFASPQNYLSFRNDQPALGMLAAVFSSPTVPSILLVPGAIALPLLLTRFTAPIPRMLLRAFIKEEAISLNKDWTQFHEYAITWRKHSVLFELDGSKIHEALISPRGGLGLTIWIDNQYASLAPGQRLRTGTLETLQESWLEIRDLRLT